MTQITDTGAGNKVVPVEVIEPLELSEEEQRLRLHLERVVERSFYEAGKALKQLRDQKLYRSSHKTFEEYCKDRFGYSSRRQPDLLIEAAAIVDNLSEKCDPMDLILPTNERQVRPLTKLEPESQSEAWQLSVEEAGGKVPSGRIVKDIVQRIRERTKVPNPYRIQQVCQIIAKDNPELRGKSGCWCIVTQVGDYSCTVETWDADYVLKLEHLKSFDYLEVECAYMQQLCLRLKKLHSLGNLDTAAYWILNGIGKLSTSYLTPLQEKLLRVLEQEYGIT
ncbi:MAG: hypothetical protein DSM106950_00270 [Stigonema ocellatum SAG 48.90 = DSM 106950]|nr:hypothetical protein [Stigonema ocellatum SAG 48.90 = DSM 106950]